MKRKVFILPQAGADLDELVKHLAQSSRRAAQRLFQSARLSIKRLGKSPDLGSLVALRRPKIAGIRAWAVRGFPNHLICYREIPQGIEVVRILHAARDMDTLFDD